MGVNEKLKVSRRQMVRAGAAMGAGVVMSGALPAGAAEGATRGKPQRPFRVAHLTDMHVQPELRGREGFEAALESVAKLDPPADLIITGGDHVMDSTAQPLDRARVQWDVYEKAIARAKIPVRSVLGNHDIWGWGLPEIPADTAGYGRAMALDRLKMKRAYDSFEAGGWKFILLDSMSRRGSSYLGALGDEQTEWLKGELAGSAEEAAKPVIVFSHIPILSACVFFDGAERLGAQAWNVPDSWMHRDMRELVGLFAGHNTKLLASGHIHLVDEVSYRGMRFVCNGAVSGNWWKGPCQQFAEGYGVIDLWADGRFENRYVSFGWKA